MAEKQASYIQASSHPADTDRLVLEGLMNPAGAPVSGALFGVGSAAGDLLVVQNGTPNMSVNVGAGHVWIDGTESATQGVYHGYNDATKNLVVAASDPTNPRKDLVVAKVQDAAYSGAVNAWTLAVVTGTPAASPAEPTVPANAVVLAMISVAALATTVTNANITDRRRRASALGGVVVCTSTTRPTTGLYEGLTIYETDTDRVLYYDGAAWSWWKNSAAGTLSGGYAENSADQTGITTQVDLTSLTSTVTVLAGRRIRIYSEMSMQSSVANDLFEAHIFADGVSVALREWRPTTPNVAETAIISRVLTPSAGAHTYKIRGGQGFGATGTWIVNGTSKPAYILVEDIGV
jgi:hypothetical protein